MGMAASQARYLALTARKTNTEYEGQQINQARTALANQSANLFNQLLGLEVPVAPKTGDFTEVQYSFSDGINKSVIDHWEQLPSPNPESNYVVTHYYYADKYTGSMKKLNDPQVQLNKGTVATTNSGVQTAYDEMIAAEAALNAATLARVAKLTESQNIANYKTDQKIELARKNDTQYDILDADDNVIATYTAYADINDDTVKLEIETVLQGLKDRNAISQDATTDDMYIDASGNVAFKEDLEKLAGVYNYTDEHTLPTFTTGNIKTVATKYDTELQDLEKAENAASIAYDEKRDFYNDLKIPQFVGNSPLVEFDETDPAQMTEIKQIMETMEEEGINDGIRKCFDANGNYTGGIYSFQMAGQTYFTTYEELMESYDSHTGPNDIDGQSKLAYYNASYINTRIEQKTEALLETDTNGRFRSVKFADDSLTYVLNTETITDTAAYDDAMNEYNYKVQQYEKTIADINARTSIIQEQDRTLELRLKQLDTEQKALSTEMDAVKKVISDNVEKSFKTFSE